MLMKGTVKKRFVRKMIPSVKNRSCENIREKSNGESTKAVAKATATATASAPNLDSIKPHRKLRMKLNMQSDRAVSFHDY